MRRCKRRIVILYPYNADENKVAMLALELMYYFGVNCVGRKPWRRRRYVVVLNGAVFAEAASAHGLRVRFWSNWRRAKLSGSV